MCVQFVLRTLSARGGDRQLVLFRIDTEPYKDAKLDGTQITSWHNYGTHRNEWAFVGDIDVRAIEVEIPNPDYRNQRDAPSGRAGRTFGVRQSKRHAPHPIALTRCTVFARSSRVPMGTSQGQLALRALRVLGQA